MKHEDGYCDECGAEVDTVQITVDGDELCPWCVAAGVRAAVVEASPARGAYDDE